MLENNQKIKYFIYVRKSQEAEDRQVQSLEDQLSKLKEIVDRFNLKVVGTFKEKKSAKDPGKRPLFEEMLLRIQNGEADGIICWEINRLTRNPVDSGKMSWLLQKEIIKSIRTYTREYRPEDNVLLFNVETGMANQFIIDLKRNTKRGLEGKVQRGWLPCLAPTGYLNSPGEKPIINDPERFHLVRKMWDMMLTGNYTPPKIAAIANKKWGFRTKRGKNHGGKELSNSSIYRIFTNQFYAGILKYNGKEYPGKHERMITLDEYDKVQILLGREGKPRSQKHQFAYTGMIRCGECGCMVTAYEITKVLKSTGEVKKYVFYECSGKKHKRYKCNQPIINLADLENQIATEVDKFTIYPEFEEWALKKIGNENQNEAETRNKEYEMANKTYTITQKQIDNLIDMRCKGFIDDEQFAKRKTELSNELVRLKANLDQVHKRAQDWAENARKAIAFAANAKDRYENGDLETKKEVLSVIGSNFVLNDRILHLEHSFWLEPIIEKWQGIKSKVDMFELAESGFNKGKEEAFTSVLPIWGR